MVLSKPTVCDKCVSEECPYLEDTIQQLLCLLQLIYRHIKDDMYVYLGAEHKYDFYLSPNVNS